jgi:hypothetical protein
LDEGCWEIVDKPTNVTTMRSPYKVFVIKFEWRDYVGDNIILFKYSILDVKQLGCELDTYNSDSLNMNIQFPE